MNKNLNNIFIKELIDSDFIFSQSTSNLNLIGLPVGSFKLSSTKKFNILDIFKLNQSLKQFIRILYFLRKTRAFKIYIWASNKYWLGLTNNFIKSFDLEEHIFCSTTFPIIDSRSGIRNFLFILGSPLSHKDNILINNKILMNDILLINKLNFKHERHSLGFYKIQNELFDYKKLLFLLVIIHSAIITK
jgi:hypothetical protein